MKIKDNKKKKNREEARELRHNKGLSIEDLALYFGKCERTIYRWLKLASQKDSPVHTNSKKKTKRSKKYPIEIFNRILELKEELPQRSTPLVHSILKSEFPTSCPSLSTIRKFIRDQGLTYKPKYRKQGYIKFERQKPNDLWQIDIAGVQTVGHLKKLYLIALLDDCSRFIVAAQYFKDQKGINVQKVIRNAVIAYGRPNQILADNGTQFRNLIGELGTKYTKLLGYLDIKPIFAKSNHPQTKGKIERWFGTVKQMFLVEARNYVKNNPKCTLAVFNQRFKKWVDWYNNEKPHRSLLNNRPPAKIFFETKNRFFRPLKAKVNWNRWLYDLAQRKVNKYNEISYKAQKFSVPPGYSGLKIDVIEHENKIELYYKDNLILTHPYNVSIITKNLGNITRKINSSGQISFKGKSYTIDYKFAGKTVEVQEINHGRTLLVYLNGVLISTLNL